MSRRTFEEIDGSIRRARAISDVDAIMRCADELVTLGAQDTDALASNARGWAEQMHGNLRAVLEHYHLAQSLHEELGNRSEAAVIVGNIGSVYFD
jgi:hypothetical protein